ncbi:MAG: polyamine aminopropyltransferase [Halothiobacillaceae bacterium]
MSRLEGDWKFEVVDEMGAAFGLKVRGKLHDEQTPWQHLEVFETERWGNLMVLDEVFMLSSLENFLYHEMMAHPAMFTHPDPKRVVIIGGGDCGTLREVLKHPGVESVIQVDIDEAVTRASERFFPELCDANDDARATLLFDDGIKWMRAAESGSVDIIIVDSTDPIGPGTGLFGPDFIADCHRVLGEGGIMVGQSESPFYHLELMKNYHRAMIAAGFGARRSLLFPQPVYPGGSITCTLASKGLSLDEFRFADAAAKPFVTRYYNAEIHRGALAQPEFMKAALSSL